MVLNQYYFSVQADPAAQEANLNTTHRHRTDQLEHQADQKDLEVLEDPEDQEDQADPEDQADTADQVSQIRVHKIIKQRSSKANNNDNDRFFLQLYLDIQTCRQAKSHPDNQAAMADPVDLMDQVRLFTTYFYKNVKIQVDPEDQEDLAALEDQKHIIQLEHQADHKDLAVLEDLVALAVPADPEDQVSQSK